MKKEKMRVLYPSKIPLLKAVISSDQNGNNKWRSGEYKTKIKENVIIDFFIPNRFYQYPSSTNYRNQKHKASKNIPRGKKWWLFLCNSVTEIKFICN